jgi:hypothetical protein
MVGRVLTLRILSGDNVLEHAALADGLALACEFKPLTPKVSIR